LSITGSIHPFLPLQLNSVLGKGAYKIVYKGIDREEGYEVAWNCFQTTKQEYTELSQEVEILKRVRHPNIINFHDCWYSNTEFIFITELMTSGTLREYVHMGWLQTKKGGGEMSTARDEI
jgi:WNK lysine deficient protein kinase